MSFMEEDAAWFDVVGGEGGGEDVAAVEGDDVDAGELLEQGEAEAHEDGDAGVFVGGGLLVAVAVVLGWVGFEEVGLGVEGFVNKSGVLREVQLFNELFSLLVPPHLYQILRRFIPIHQPEHRPLHRHNHNTNPEHPPPPIRYPRPSITHLVNPQTHHIRHQNPQNNEDLTHSA